MPQSAIGTHSTYDPRQHRLEVLTGLSKKSSVSTVPLGRSAIGPGDPIAFIRELLAAGELEEHGTRERNGRRVLTLTGERTDANARITTHTRVVYDVDPNTYRPVRITTVRNMRPTDPSRCSNRCSGLRTPRGERIDFRTYERLPLNTTTGRLLTITPPSGTRVREQTLTEARRTTARALRAQDRKAKQRQRQVERP